MGAIKLPEKLIGFILNLNVTGGPEGDKEIHFTEGRFVKGHHNAATTALTLPYDLCYKALLQNDTKVAMKGFLTRKIRVKGDMTKMLTLASIKSEGDLEALRLKNPSSEDVQEHEYGKSNEVKGRCRKQNTARVHVALSVSLRQTGIQQIGELLCAIYRDDQGGRDRPDPRPVHNGDEGPAQYPKPSPHRACYCAVQSVRDDHGTHGGRDDSFSSAVDTQRNERKVCKKSARQTFGQKLDRTGCICARGPVHTGGNTRYVGRCRCQGRYHSFCNAPP